MKEKSIKKNIFLNTARTLLNVIFPLITFPYIARILSPKNIGIYDFSRSINGYFILIAGLGITQYAVREGAFLRNDKKKLEEFSSEIFSINLLSSIVSYLFLFITLFFSSYLKDYQNIILIFSLQILFNTVSVEWLYTIHEDFFYITVRSILVQVVSVVLMFCFVKKPEDYINYAWITTLSSGGAGLFNFFHAKVYCKLKLVVRNLKQHIPPILILFSNDIASTIYINSDVTVIGFINGNYYVGIYSIAVKIYTMVKQVSKAVILVVVPRLSNYYLTDQQDKYSDILKKVFEIVSLLTFPASMGLIMLRHQIVSIIAGEKYYRSADSLAILAVSLLFSIFATYLVYGFLLVQRKEKDMLRITIISAIVNLILNFLSVPFIQEKGAAISTMISELLVVLLTLKKIDLKYRPSLNKKTIMAITVECLFILLICVVVKKMFNSALIIIVVSAGLSLFVYFVLLYLFKISIKI
ncbi:flippase [Enterococcus avium]|nr:flippase [Enterococcus avium]